MSDETPDPTVEAPAEEPPAEASVTTEAPELSEPAYVPRQVVEDDLGGMSLEEAYAASMVEVEDGQIVEGTVVKVDRDEVLLDIGYKSEGVIPARELRLLCERVGLHVDAVWSVEPGRYQREPPTIESPELLVVGRRA